MRTLLIWGSLILWLNAAWAQTYPCGAFPSLVPSGGMKPVRQISQPNPFIVSGSGVKPVRQNSSSSLSQPTCNSSNIPPIISPHVTGGARTRQIALLSNSSSSGGFGTATGNTSLLSSRNTSHLLTASVTGIAAGGLATAGLVALAASATASTVGVATLLTGGTAVLLTGAAGVATGGLATAGLMSLATALGTASTGTAIASLSGAAAYSSALAWQAGLQY